MTFRNTNQSWGSLSKALHWLIVILIINQWVIAERAEELKGLAKLQTLGWHKSFGMTIRKPDASRLRIDDPELDPVWDAMGRMGLTPNALTLIGFGITAVGSLLVGVQAWVIGGIVVVVVGGRGSAKRGGRPNLRHG